MFTVTHHHQKHVTLDENITLNQWSNCFYLDLGPKSKIS